MLVSVGLPVSLEQNKSGFLDNGLLSEYMPQTHVLLIQRLKD